MLQTKFQMNQTFLSREILDENWPVCRNGDPCAREVKIYEINVFILVTISLILKNYTSTQIFNIHTCINFDLATIYRFFPNLNKLAFANRIFRTHFCNPRIDLSSDLELLGRINCQHNENYTSFNNHD